MGEKIRGKEEYFILPENVLGILLSFGKFRDEGEFDLVGLLPCGYLEYITKVVNANRHLRAFAYPDMGEGGALEMENMQDSGETVKRIEL